MVHRYLQVIVASLLFASAAAAAPVLYYTDVTSAPAGSFVCVAGRGFPAQASATLKLDGAAGNCTICDSGCDDTFTTYNLAWTRGTAPNHLCFEMPASSGDCTDTFTGVILNDGSNDSNTLTLTRHAGNVRWVATTGSDSAAGTEAAPWKTVAKGTGSVGTGDAVIFRGGTYGEHMRYTGTNGTASLPVVFRGYPGETPIVQGSTGDGAGTCTGGYHAIDNGKDYVQFANIKMVQNASGFGSTGASVRGNGNRVADCWSYQMGVSGAFCEGSRINCTLVGNDFEDNGTVTCGGHGAYLEGDTFNVSHNKIFDNYNTGIQTYSGSVGDDPDGDIHANMIYNNANNEGAKTYSNIHIYTRSNGVDVYNNLVWSTDETDWGIYVGWNSTNTDVFNNTLYNHDEVDIYIANSASNVVVKNNIVYNPQAAGYVISEASSGSGFTIDYNLYYAPSMTNPFYCGTAAKANFAAWQAGSGCGYTPDANGVNADPVFQVIGSDFSLQDTSPAIDAGTAPPETRILDIRNATAPDNSVHDIGAYEFQTTAGVVPTVILQGGTNKGVAIN